MGCHFLKSLSINLASQADQLTRLLRFCHILNSIIENKVELLIVILSYDSFLFWAPSVLREILIILSETLCHYGSALGNCMNITESLEVHEQKNDQPNTKRNYYPCYCRLLTWPLYITSRVYTPHKWYYLYTSPKTLPVLS